jgi:SAM-dependent methyltransferase
VATWQQAYLNRFYDRSRGWVDGTTEFHDLCASAIPGGRILEVGAGPANKNSRYFAGLGELHGIDPDSAIRDNDALKSAAILGDDGAYPYEDESFDGCISSFVVEHIGDPQSHLREVRRVLKPGAPYVFRTPNVRHFVYLSASVTPHRVHLAVANRLRNLPPEVHEPWPTEYAMNSPRAIRDAARDTGLAVEHLRLIEKEPSYGMASRALFFPFMAYERLVNATERLASFRATILCVLRRRQ